MKYHLTGAFLYIRQSPTQAETERFEPFLDDRDLVMGDLNLDRNRKDDAKKIELLCKKRSIALEEITTIWFNQLDHILLDKNLFPVFYTTTFRNHTTDHYTIVFRLPILGSKFLDSFLMRMNFDGEHWTKNQKRKPSEEIKAQLVR